MGGGGGGRGALDSGTLGQTDGLIEVLVQYSTYIVDEMVKSSWPLKAPLWGIKDSCKHNHFASKRRPCSIALLFGHEWRHLYVLVL